MSSFCYHGHLFGKLVQAQSFGEVARNGCKNRGNDKIQDF